MESIGDDAGGIAELPRGVGEEGDEWLARCKAIAEFGVHLDPGVGADGLAGAIAAGAEALHGPADGGAIHAREEARVRGPEGCGCGRGGWCAKGLSKAERSPPCARTIPRPGIVGAAAAEEIVGEGVAGSGCWREAGEVEHVAGEGEREIDEVAAVRVGGGTSELEDLNALGDLEPVAGEAAERLVHGGEECDGAGAGGLACLDHEIGEEAGLGVAGHEGAGADFDVEDEAVEGLGEFLAHDAGGDEEGALDGAGVVAHGVEESVGGDEVGGLSDHDGAHQFEDAGDVAERELGVEARDGLELV